MLTKEMPEDLGKELIQLIWKQDAKNIESLLKSGADPNFCFENEAPFGFPNRTPLQIAAEELNPSIIKLLLSYEANPILCPAGKLPLAIAVKNYQERSRSSYPFKEAIESCNLLWNSTKMLSTHNQFLAPTYESLVKQSIEKQYRKLEAVIKNGIENSIKSQKQLSIMVGEDHEYFPSFILEAIILLIAKKYDIKTVLTEHTKAMEKGLQQQSNIPGNTCWQVPVARHHFAKKLDMISIPVDLGRYGAAKIGKNFDDYEELTDWPDTSYRLSQKSYAYKVQEDITQRNKVIRDVITDGIHVNSMLFIGSKHIFGLLEETPFPADKFEIVAINANHRVYPNETEFGRSCTQYARKSPHIYQANEEHFTEVASFLSPEIAGDLVLDVHTQLNQNENTNDAHCSSPFFTQKIKQSSPKDIIPEIQPQLQFL